MSSPKRLPTTTVTPARVRLFEATNRPTGRIGETIQTSWGTCVVTGILGQRHADLLEAILYVASDVWLDQDGATCVLVDPAQLRKILSDRGHSGGRVKAWLEDLLSATVIIENPAKELRAEGYLIDRFVETEPTYRNPLPGKGGRCLWILHLGTPLVVLLENDLHLSYDPRGIARMKHGITKAIARHLLSHRAGTKNRRDLDSLIITVAGQVGAAHLRKHRLNVRAEREELEVVGIVFDGPHLWRPEVRSVVKTTPNRNSKAKKHEIDHIQSD